MGFDAPAIRLTELTERGSSRVDAAEISGVAMIASDATDAVIAGTRRSGSGPGSIPEEAEFGLKAEVSFITESTVSVASDAAIAGICRSVSGPGSSPEEADTGLKAEVSLATESTPPARGDVAAR
jgi:hypothetical protein